MHLRQGFEARTSHDQRSDDAVADGVGCRKLHASVAAGEGAAGDSRELVREISTVPKEKAERKCTVQQL